MFSLLDEIIEHGRLGAEPAARERARRLVTTFVGQALEGSIVPGGKVELAVKRRIEEIDRLLSVQLDEIMHHPSFQRLESAWRGIKYLVDESKTGAMLKVRIVNCGKADLFEDLTRAPNPGHSAIFEKVHEWESVSVDGEPFGVLVGDYEFGCSPNDMEVLEQVSHVAATIHAPFIAAASPTLLSLRSGCMLERWTDLPRHLMYDGSVHARWMKFRRSEESRYTVLTCPRFLGRQPYGKATTPIEEFDYEEHTEGSGNRQYLWLNSAYALASTMSNSFSQYGLCHRIQGVEGGGQLESLPVRTFSKNGDVTMSCPAEASLDDQREQELVDFGLTPLVHCRDSDYAAFTAVPSCQKPRLYDSDGATKSARLLAQIPTTMFASRFAHCLKAIMRDTMGAYMSRAHAEELLNRWISRYVKRDDMPMRCGPLDDAHIDVSEIPGKPGVYRAVALLRPGPMELPDDLPITLRIVVDLPPNGRSKGSQLPQNGSHN